MSLFGDYISETRCMNIVHHAFGFATYIISGDECYIEDVFVKKERRRDRIASRMVNEIKYIAKCRECKTLTTTVNGKFKDPDSSLKACLAYGFKINRILNDIIFLKMEI